MESDREPMIDYSARFKKAIPRRFLQLDEHVIAEVHRHYDFAIFLPVRQDAYDRALFAIASRTRTMRAKQFGYRGWRFVCYWWTVSMRAISFGVHVHVLNPVNLELHLPFGFIRIGFTDQTERVAQYEEWLVNYIVELYEEEVELWAKLQTNEDEDRPRSKTGDSLLKTTRNSLLNR